MNPKKTILITGGTGMIGNALIKKLRLCGVENIYCSTRTARTDSSPVHYLHWDGMSELRGLPAQVDVAINLAGENIGEGRWTETRKKLIRESRLTATRYLVQSLAKLDHRPTLLLSASAIGYYGSNASTIISETSPQGEGFLAALCAEWEGEAREAERLGITVTTARFGIVLSRNGGALKKMLPPFYLGLGSVLGSGTQYMSWISLDDLVDALIFLGEDPHQGAINVCSPAPCTNSEFTRALAHALRRPAFMTLPAWLISGFFGEMGSELLLSSARVSSQLLEQYGFTFRDHDLLSFLTREFTEARA